MPRSGSDGAIIIDSRIDTSGFNEGVSNLGKQLRTIATAGAVGILTRKVWVGLVKGIKNTITAVKRLARGFRMFIRGIEYISRIGRRIEEVKTEFENLRVQLYAALLPAIFAILPALYKVIHALKMVARYIAYIIGALTGQKTVIEANVQGVEDLADGTAAAREEAEGALAAFDEIDVLEQPDENTGGGGAGVGDLGQVEIPIPSGILEFFERLRAILAPLKEPLIALWDAIKLVATTLWDILVPAFGGAMEEGGFFDVVVAGIVTAVEWLTEKLTELAAWMVENPDKVEGFVNVLLLLGAALVVGVLAATLLVLVVLGAFLVIMGFLIAAVVLFIVELIKAWPAIKAFFSQIYEAVKEWGINTQEKLYNLRQKFEEFVANVKEKFIAFVAKLEERIQYIKDFWASKWDAIKQKFEVILSNIKEKFVVFVTNIKEKFVVFIDKLRERIQYIKDFWAGAWDAIKLKFEGILNGIRDFWAGVWDAIKLKVEVILRDIKHTWFLAKLWFGDVFDNIGERWDTFTDGLKDGIKAALNVAIGWVEGFANLFIRAINAMIGVLNKISIDLPNIPFLGLEGGTIGFNIATLGEISVPRLATGAVIQPNAPFAAILGDQRSGTNIETPEELMRKIVREETGSNQGQQELTINFGGNLGALVRELKPYIDRENARIGTSMVKGL